MILVAGSSIGYIRGSSLGVSNFGKKDYVDSLSASVDQPLPLSSSFVHDNSTLDILSVLFDSDVFLSMKYSLCDTDLEQISRPDFWDEVTLKQREIIDCCLADKASLLNPRRSKLVLSDLEYIRTFSTKTHDFSNASACDIHIVNGCIYELRHEFIIIARNLDYKSSANIVAISNTTDKFISIDYNLLFTDMPIVLQGTLYYIAGWCINAMKKVSFRRKASTKEPMLFLIALVNIPQTAAQELGLPTGKIDRVMAFGGLYFCSFDFFVLISRIENTFRVLLSEEALLIHGSFLLEKIRRNIFLSEIFKLELSSFLPKNLETEQRNIIAVYLVSIYTRMRCKDFAYKLLKKGSKLKICTRSLQAALSNPAYRKTK